VVCAPRAESRWVIAALAFLAMLVTIPSPPSNGFHLGPLFVHAYGLAYVLAVVAAVAITSRRWERAGGDRGLVNEVAMWGFPAGLVGGRLYFLATSWSEVPHHWWGPFAVWEGGLGIWGGIAVGTLAGLFVLRRRGADIAQFMDAAAPALLVAQAIGRIGNYFNQELFGGPTGMPWALQISPAHRPSGYEQFGAFHPTFLYELIWNLALAGALVWIGHHRRIRAPGLFALYVAGYSLGRIGEELLRVDPAHHIAGLRLNFYVATLLCLAGLIWLARIQHWAPPWPWVRRGSALVLVGAVVAFSGCGYASRATATAAALDPPLPYGGFGLRAQQRDRSAGSSTAITTSRSMCAWQLPMSSPSSICRRGEGACLGWFGGGDAITDDIDTRTTRDAETG
jgi:prolipoprotein diacylglyceryl transferase